MKKVCGVLAALMITLGALGLLTSMAQEGKEAKEPTAAERAKTSKATEVIRNIELANQLIDFGRAKDSPAALLLAAEILHKNPVKDDSAKRNVKISEETKAKKEVGADYPQVIFAEAKKMAEKFTDKRFDSLILATEKALGESALSPYPGGYFARTGHLDRGNRHTYRLHCHGHTHAHVYPTHAHGYVDLDIRVYRNGQLIAIDNSTASSARVHFDGEGDFVIEVHLFNGDHCDYRLVVN